MADAREDRTVIAWPAPVSSRDPHQEPRAQLYDGTWVFAESPAGVLWAPPGDRMKLRLTCVYCFDRRPEQHQSCLAEGCECACATDRSWPVFRAVPEPRDIAAPAELPAREPEPVRELLAEAELRDAPPPPVRELLSSRVEPHAVGLGRGIRPELVPLDAVPVLQPPPHLSGLFGAVLVSCCMMTGLLVSCGGYYWQKLTEPHHHIAETPAPPEPPPNVEVLSAKLIPAEPLPGQLRKGHCRVAVAVINGGCWIRYYVQKAKCATTGVYEPVKGDCERTETGYLPEMGDSAPSAETPQ